MLLIDDEPFNLIILENFFKQHRIKNIRKEFSTEGALSYLDECEKLPDLIISDIQMQPLNGFDFIEKFREFYDEGET